MYITMKSTLLTTLALACALTAVQAEQIEVKRFRHAGPYAVQAPFMVDSLDVNRQAYNAKSALELPIAASAVASQPVTEVSTLQGEGLHVLGFTLEANRYAQATLKVEGAKDYVVYVDGQKAEGEQLTLAPGTHELALKCLTAAEGAQPKVTLQTEDDGALALREDGQRFYSLADVLHASKYAGVDVSADGKYLITAIRRTAKGGKSQTTWRVTETATGRVLAERAEALAWMPRSARYYYVSRTTGTARLMTVDPATGREAVLVSELPEGEFIFSPAEDYLLFTLTQEGPAERKDVYEVIHPEDRQPGWRTRIYPARYDLASGQMQPIAYGHHNAWISSLSADGRKGLLVTSASRLSQRPTTVFSLYQVDMSTLKAEKLVDDDGFFTDALLSPDATEVLLCGSPEAFGGIGKNVREGQTPSMMDVQLYRMTLKDKKITALTRQFNPNVQHVEWSPADSQVYFTAENRDLISLYRLNPKTGDIRQIAVGEDLVNGFALSQQAPVMAWYGQSASNSDRLYTLSTKTLKSTQAEDLNADLLRQVELGECKAWDFVNSRGDTISGRFYLPPHFDASKSYPMIVNYYGGCSPTSRNFESRYPHHVYAAMGYVVYVINPSGATGFGQEFSARHVNTAGEGVAQDIIEGTRRFCEEHPYVNPKKIGCIGASYGGFMTQYLQTQTDLFAAAISHAGISDHTSYWGEGYWGYSYSEVSMANSYPWSDTDLYVKQSPLYNADKIHTPLLFVHGDADHNVPVGESIQLFTALKLLGRETAFVAVTDQDHHILDYDKRIRWQNTIFAWFAKWLQDDDAWWKSMYPDKSL
jgi:dipeptidyl aminopeptidase/acylaminoacyl peptidase